MISPAGDLVAGRYLFRRFPGCAVVELRNSIQGTTSRKERSSVTDVHITVEMLRAVERGEVAPRILVEIGIEHLAALCPHCREELRAWQAARTVATRPEAALQALPSVLSRHSTEAEEKRKEAERDFQELSALPHPIRLIRVRRAAKRFRGVILAGLFLRDSKRIVPGDPGLALELAQTAEAVLLQSRAVPGIADVYARSYAFQANALRAQGLLQGAESRFAFARFFIRQQGVTDPALIAEIDSCEAVLALDQRRFAEAEKLLNRSIQMYAIAGECTSASHPMLTLGRLHALRGEYVKAIEIARSAAETAGEGDRRLALYARHNQATYLCEAGSFETAAATIAEARDLYEELSDSFTQRRLAWLEGKIAAGRGRLEEARPSSRSISPSSTPGRAGPPRSRASPSRCIRSSCPRRSTAKPPLLSSFSRKPPARRPRRSRCWRSYPPI
jgi:hypothetical protein